MHGAVNGANTVCIYIIRKGFCHNEVNHMELYGPNAYMEDGLSSICLLGIVKMQYCLKKKHCYSDANFIDPRSYTVKILIISLVFIKIRSDKKVGVFGILLQFGDGFY